MRLITRCPACGTMFRVVPDQLRISEGWVRCGRCSEVFDGSRNLQVLAAPPKPMGGAQEVPVAPTMPQPTEPVKAPSVESRHSDEEGAGVAKTDKVQARVQDASGNDRVLPDTSPAVGTSASPKPISGASLLTRRGRSPAPPAEEVDALESIFLPDPTDADLPTKKVSVGSDRGPDSVLDEDVSFVREANRKAFWRRPSVRWMLALGAVMLLGTLALQVLVNERDRLAALYPELRPGLVRLCGALHCKVEVPRQIESVVIDNSSFARVRGDLFRLGFVLRNTAGADVASPSVELTLTDSQERPVVRRVFGPAEFGSKPVLAPKEEWSAVLNFSVASGGDNLRVAGYRLLAFYP